MPLGTTLTNTGRLITLMREFRGVTRDDTARVVGMSEVFLRNLEAGKPVPMLQLQKIAEALGFTVKLEATPLETFDAVKFKQKSDQIRKEKNDRRNTSDRSKRKRNYTPRSYATGTKHTVMEGS